MVAWTSSFITEFEVYSICIKMQIIIAVLILGKNMKIKYYDKTEGFVCTWVYFHL